MTCCSTEITFSHVKFYILLDSFFGNEIFELLWNSPCSTTRNRFQRMWNWILPDILFWNALRRELIIWIWNFSSVSGYGIFDKFFIFLIHFLPFSQWTAINPCNHIQLTLSAYSVHDITPSVSFTKTLWNQSINRIFKYYMLYYAVSKINI